MQAKSVLDTPIFHKTYELYRLLYRYENQVPKNHRYTVWQKCEQGSLDILTAIIRTGYTQGDVRLNAIRKVSENLDLLKVFIRLARETNSINQKVHLEIQNLVQEIGKMVGGWLKFVPTEKNPSGK